MISIREIQGESLNSPYAGQNVTTEGVVSGIVRRGFFLQTPNKQWDGKGSDGIYVFSPKWTPEQGAVIKITGEVRDFYKHDTARPVTQLHMDSVEVSRSSGASLQAIEFSQDFLPTDNKRLAELLNSLEGMLIRIPAGQTFIGPSNKYGDYVLAMDRDGLDESEIRTEFGGLLPTAGREQRWFPGFRTSNYNHAHRLNVGAKLRSAISGPLNYRADAYQLSVSQPFEIEPAFIEHSQSSFRAESNHLTIMTLNCFNLDPVIERESKVTNPRIDIDDDWGDGRFHALAQSIVLQANSPDIVALQEIQDNDGAELTHETDASVTYEHLITCVRELDGPDYRWADIPPELGMDGGQPGGNIRNGFLYNPERVSLDNQSLRVLGRDLECFEDSRKPLVGEFTEIASGNKLALINVHLASKRHQESIFAPENPGVDAKLDVRVAQAQTVFKESQELSEKGIEFYITGDFNDTEHSLTLDALLGGLAAVNHNLVMDLPESERYDYNHRGKLQVLMHGIVNKKMAIAGKAEYEIIHGNELLGVGPGEESGKPSDHAYVIAKLNMQA